MEVRLSKTAGDVSIDMAVEYDANNSFERSSVEKMVEKLLSEFTPPQTVTLKSVESFSEEELNAFLDSIRWSQARVTVNGEA